MSIVINGSTGIQMASDDSLEFGTVGISQDTLFSGRKNVIINGDFDVWQRGTGAFTTDGSFVGDRWKLRLGTATASCTQSSFTLGQTDVPNEPKYYSSNTITTASAAGELAIVAQYIEGVRTLAGQTATLSFYAKADAAKDIAIEVEQYFGTGGSPSATVTGISVTTCSLTTSWQKFEVTVNMPSISGKTIGSDNNDHLIMNFWLTAGSDWNARTNSLGNQSGTFDIAQVQLEKGSQATAFEKRSYGEELALCQRYYESSNGTSGFAVISNVSGIFPAVNFAVTKRAVPTMTVTPNSGGGAVLSPSIMGFYQSVSNSANNNASWTADAEL